MIRPQQAARLPTFGPIALKWSRPMKTLKIIFTGAACILLAACGVTETATTTAAIAAAKAKEIEQGKQQMEQVKQQIDAANQQAEAQRKAMESAAQ